jgi:hypothetical protein
MIDGPSVVLDIFLQIISGWQKQLLKCVIEMQNNRKHLEKICVLFIISEKEMYVSVPGTVL